MPPKMSHDAWGLPIRTGGPAWGRSPDFATDNNSFGIDLDMMLIGDGGKTKKGGKRAVGGSAPKDTSKKVIDALAAENLEVQVNDALNGHRRSARNTNIDAAGTDLEAKTTDEQAAISNRSLRKRQDSNETIALKSDVDLSTTSRQIISFRRQTLDPKPSVPSTNRRQSIKDFGVEKRSEEANAPPRNVARQYNGRKRPVDDSEDEAQPNKQKLSQLRGLQTNKSKSTKDMAAEMDVTENNKKRKAAEDSDSSNQAQRKKQKLTLRVSPAPEPEHTVIGGAIEWTKPPKNISQYAQKMTRVFATSTKDISMFRVDFCDMRTGLIYRKVFAHQEDFDFKNTEDRTRLNKWRGNIYTSYTDSKFTANTSSLAVASGSSRKNTMKETPKATSSSSAIAAASSDTNRPKKITIPASVFASASARTNASKEIPKANTSVAPIASGSSRRNVSKETPKATISPFAIATSSPPPTNARAFY